MPPAAKPRPYSRAALAAATGATAFTLVLTGAIIGPLSGRLAPQVASPAPAGPAPSPEAALAAAIEEREAAYRDALAQAQTQLDEAARQRAILEAALVQPSPAPPVPQQAVPQSQQPASLPPAAPPQAVQPAQPGQAPLTQPVPAIGRDQAIQIARAVAAGAPVEEVRPRTENGLPAFEIRFVNDARAVVDATSGRILSSRLGETSTRSGSSGSGSSGSSGRGGRG